MFKGPLNTRAKKFHDLAHQKGFYDNYSDVNIPEKLALIHSEISEALEAYRDGDMITCFKEGKLHGFPMELADALIRILDLAAYLNIDIDAEVNRKYAYNKKRAYKHGGKIA